LYVTTSVEIAGRLLIGTTSNGIDTNSGKLRAVGSYREDIVIALRPEFEGAVLRPDGSNNVGYMSSDFCSGSSGRMNINATACLNSGGTSSEEHTYYEWTTIEASAQDYDVYVRWRVPDNFDNGTLDTGSI